MNPPIKWHGGKHYLAPQLWEIAKRVPHVHRVETHGGGLAFTLASEPEGYSEVVNDVHGPLTNFWRVIQCPASFVMFAEAVSKTPCCERFYEESAKRLEQPCERPDTKCVACALHFFICCRQSRAATFKGFATLAKTRTRRGMNELPSAWWTSIDGMPQVYHRLRRVVVLNRDAIECIRTQDGEETLFYADPPYFPESRATPNVYRHEMTAAQHTDLLTTLGGIKGKFMLSGYRNPIYDDAAEYHGWKRHEFELPNNAAGGDTKRRMIECVWTNFRNGAAL